MVDVVQAGVEYSDEYPPMMVQIRGKEYACEYPDRLGGVDWSIFMHALGRRDQLWAILRTRPWTDAEAKEFNERVDKALSIVVPGLGPRTLKRLSTGEKAKVLGTFLDLEAPESRRVALQSALVTLAMLSPQTLNLLLTKINAPGSSPASGDGSGSA